MQFKCCGFSKKRFDIFLMQSKCCNFSKKRMFQQDLSSKCLYILRYSPANYNNHSLVVESAGPPTSFQNIKFQNTCHIIIYYYVQFWSLFKSCVGYESVQSIAITVTGRLWKTWSRSHFFLFSSSLSSSVFLLLFLCPIYNFYYLLQNKQWMNVLRS